MKDSELERKKEVFYKAYADGTFRFDDGQTISINRCSLAAKSSVFDQLFRNSSPKFVIDIKDYDSTIFKLFLDCLMDFKKYTTTDVLLIFPIAVKYEAKSFIKSCIDILKPSTLNDDTCMILNMALICDCDELADMMTGFLDKKNLIYKLLDEEKYYFSLEPKSMDKLLSKIYVDSYVLMNVIKWADNYLRMNQKRRVDTKQFLKKHNIFRYLSLECFETTSSIFEFNKTELGKNFFSSQECWLHVGEFGFKPRESAWFKIKAGEQITEKFLVKQVPLFQNRITEIRFFRNPLICFDFIESDTIHATDVELSYNLKHIGNQFCKHNFWDPLKYILGKYIFYRLKIFHNSASCIQDIEIDLRYTFNFDFRILKTSPKDNLVPCKVNERNLYFVKSVETIVHEKP